MAGKSLADRLVAALRKRQWQTAAELADHLHSRPEKVQAKLDELSSVPVGRSRQPIVRSRAGKNGKTQYAAKPLMGSRLFVERRERLEKWGLTADDLPDVERFDLTREPSCDINRPNPQSVDELLSWLKTGRGRAARIAGYRLDEAQAAKSVASGLIHVVTVEDMQARCRVLVNDVLIHAPKFGLQPPAMLSDETQLATGCLDAAIAWLEVPATTDTPPIPPNNASDHQPDQPSGVAARNKYFSSLKSNGLTPAKIRDHWNSLSQVERERIAPSAANAIASGEQGRDLVKKATAI